MKHLTEMVRQHKAGKTNGIYAVCSAHPLVLEAAIRYTSANQTPLLIEATSNQVDQFGGYTGMTPADFRGFVCQLADSLNFPQDALILGGDHLGPNRWQNLPAAQAMANADDLIKSYVAAGFKKIHLDCSMSCQDDPIPLTDDIVAERAARLARGYSYSDRVRYYWPDSQIDDAFAHLVRNLADSPIPLPLISQYLPLQYVKVRSGELQPTPRELIINHIQDILAQYHTACEGQ
ncbi:class II D-tagatose-bisphosphate aldolase, non-catalytic subunit [Escherichia coli]|nr:hypothetical protein [Escherichia coli]